MKGIVAKDRLLRLPTTYANAINDPRTNALALQSINAPVGLRATLSDIPCKLIESAGIRRIILFRHEYRRKVLI
ncbi:hypothetical protein G6M04_13550 [Agrobacterium rhizogenes]|uniref:hypothetical protein n=1 Tax=Rhizobium rhizogenes TaxID=359 RepID=UPI0015731660|nr:hypothetical protein [Rhizobium rhizogenes]NTG48413.1 hypothetical protein [Rhizobium rhizogenes]